MAARRRVEPPEEHANHERWLLTYSDMITLLMVLFIVLFALGQTDVRKFNAFKQSFHTASIQPAPVTRGGTGVLAAENALRLGPPLLRPTVPSVRRTNGSPTGTPIPSLHQLQQQLEAALQQAGLAGMVRFGTNASGLAVTIATDKILFATGSAQLLPLGLEIIDTLAPVLRHAPQDLDVQGHTDNQPISGGLYPSNWELSTARATAVLHDLIDLGIAPDRLSASGYGDTRPLVPNNTPAHRTENRRVEIVVLAHPIAS